MAVATYLTTQSSRRGKKELPCDEVIYREYAHQVMSCGERGAYARTAKAFNNLFTDQHASNAVKRHLARQPKPVGVEYVPAPGEAELAKERERVATELALATEHANEHLLRQLLEQETPTERQEVYVEASSGVLPMEKERTLVEPEEATIPYDLFANKVVIDRRRENQVIELRIYVGVTGAISLGLLAIASVAPLLSLAMLLPTLGMWWCVIGLRRLL